MPLSLAWALRAVAPPAATPDGPRSADVPENPAKALPKVRTPVVNDQAQEVSVPIRRARCPLWVVGTPDYEVGVRDLGTHPERVTLLFVELLGLAVWM